MRPLIFLAALPYIHAYTPVTGSPGFPGGPGSPGTTATPRNSTTPCNGSPLFCDLRYDQYTFPATYQAGSYNLNGDCTPSKLNSHPCSIFNSDKCFYYNHGDRDLLRQLADGIRSFNFQTCVYGTGPQDSYAVLCSSVDGTRALGEDVADTIDALRSWLDDNPDEVIELEFDAPSTEDVTVMAPYVQEVLQDKLNGLWLRRSVVTRRWPTLGQMIDADKRVVIFVTDYFYTGLTGTPPTWILLQSLYYLPSLQYTQAVALPKPTDSNALTLNQFSAYVQNIPYLLTHFCRHPDTGLLAARWQNLDMEYPNLYRCPLQVANAINQLGRQIAFYCLPKVYFHRFRTMTYYVGFEIESLVKRINLARYQLLLASVSAATTT